MAMAKAEIQKRSDEKRGVKLCSFKLKQETIAKLEQEAAKAGLSKTALLERPVGICRRLQIRQGAHSAPHHTHGRLVIACRPCAAAHISEQSCKPL